MADAMVATIGATIAVTTGMTGATTGVTTGSIAADRGLQSKATPGGNSGRFCVL
jgi:hypothetical protein